MAEGEARVRRCGGRWLVEIDTVDPGRVYRATVKTWDSEGGRVSAGAALAWVEGRVGLGLLLPVEL